MKKAFSINLFDGHLIVNENGKEILVDTGSPFSLSREKEFLFMENQRHVATNVGGQSVEEIGQLLGYPIDVLLGMDIISKLYAFVDYKQKQVVFSDEEFLLDGFSELIMEKSVLGAMCVPLIVDGQIMTFALDTGAKISYVDEFCTSSETPVEECDDFNPLVGHFNTPIYNMQAMIGDTSFPVRFGTLPQSLSIPLKMMGLDGVIGYDLFVAFTVVMDFKRNALFYKRVI